MIFHKILACIGLISISATSAAETWGPFEIVEPTPISELWLNAGFYSYHFQKNKGFNNRNFGIGGEYQYSTVSSIVVGSSHNSVRHMSHYVGWNWHPIALGPVHFGVVAGGVNGYPGVNNGGWFPVVIPAASIEYKSIGANLIFIPSFKDKLYGALSLQLKVKLY
ncbi:MAG: hypothetical protein Q7S51_04170 [Gallionellaceae bacterium]|nr:hypothetical protein [Gallionellaceae bacterium]